MSSGADNGPGKGKQALGTRLSHAARDRKLTLGGVNPVVQRASTVIVESASKLFEPGGWTYGRHGTATHEALKQALLEIEDAKHCALVPSGLLACTVPFIAFAEAGAHVLVGDNVYGPTRRWCDRTMSRWGCETEYFDPTIGGDIAKLIRPTTKMIFMESPGSMTFEIADAPAIAVAAKAHNVVTVMDNTWSGGVFYRPLDLGFDISVQANTKYVSGGADALNGSIFANSEQMIARINEAIADLGLNVGADDAYAVLRGARSLAMRMERHQASALEVARWLATHPAVQRVIHPALETDPGHALWKRDFTGSSGLFGIVLKPSATKQVHAFLDALDLFGLGFSYGGFESLAIHCDPQLKRTVTKPAYGGPLIRLSVGLEDPADLIADLDQALKQLG
ncbi:MAG TPA: cystathionine beta-lyase [Hyphomonadaceae bacterium]|nr:cystathionine beta-lyase [Hyphomonadaceae bacterium]HPN05636.1 cystathionine beta-lyase [Hyphomonadaceae bacterium]